MNTWIWGPPKWKFLHTLSFSPQVPRYSVQIGAFVNTLKFVLPCIFCRDSYTGFVTALEQKYGMPVAAVAQAGRLSHFFYDLHDLVNNKLDKQNTHEQLEKQGVDVSTLSVAQDTAMCRKRQITFECLSKRFAIRPVQMCADDLWEVLLIFALNMDDTWSRASEEQKQNWIHFFDLLPLMVQVATGVEHNGLPRLLHDTKAATRQAIEDGKMTIFSTIVYKKCVFDSTDYSPERVNQYLTKMSAARATTCIHGSCK